MTEPASDGAEPVRLALLRQAGLLDQLAGSAFERLTRLAASALAADGACIALAAADTPRVLSCFGMQEPAALDRQSILIASACRSVVALREPLVVEDTRGHPLAAHEAPEVGACLAVPLILADVVLGALCVTSAEPRPWTEREVAVAVDLAAVIVKEIEDRLEPGAALQAPTDASHYRALVEHLPVVVYTATPGTLSHTLYVSPRLDALLGFSPEEWLSTPTFWLEQVHPDDRALVLAENERTTALESDFELEYRLIDREGRVVWIHDEATLIRNRAGAPSYWQGVWLDVTERKHIQQQLLLQHQVARILAESPTLVAAAPAILAAIGGTLGWALGDFWQPDSSGEVVRCVATWQAAGGVDGSFVTESRQLELPRGAGLAWRVWSEGQPVWIPDMATDHRIVRASLAADSGVHAALAFPVHDGQSIVGVFELFSSYVQSADQQLVELAQTLALQIGQFVTRERSESALRESEERFRAAHMAVGQVTHALDGRLLSVNRSLCEMTGYTEAELLATDLRSISHPEDLTASAEPLRRLLAGETEVMRFHKRYLRKDGSVLHALVSAALARDAAGTPRYLISLIQDISELQGALEALARLEQRQRLILDTAGEGICGLDRDGRTTFVNASATRMLGFSVDELLGSIQHDLIHHHYEDGRPYPRDACPLYATLRDGVAHHGADEVFWRKDGSSFPIEYWSTPILRDGVIDGAVISFADITERREAEQRSAQQRQAFQQAKLEADLAREEAEDANRVKSEFLSRMSHELRTPLNAILGFAQVLEMDDLTAEQQEIVGYILKGGYDLLALVNDVLDITRLGAGGLPLSLEPVGVRDVVVNVVALMRPLATRRKIAMVVDESVASAPYVLADLQRFRQVLLNLVSNAVKYNVDGGQVLLTITSGAGTSGPAVRIVVRDTGPGISAAHQARLFAPFERLGVTDALAEGTGLGLVLSKALMTAMGGAIGLTSVIGEGSTFWIELPLADEPGSEIPADARIASAAADPAVRPRTVLYVDDNIANLRLVEHLITFRPSITLLNAMQGGMGIALAREHAPDLILLDLQLPDVPGDEVLARLLADPETRDIPVVVMSADATPRQVDRLLERGARDYLPKPLDVRRFLATLDRFLYHAPPTDD